MGESENHHGPESLPQQELLQDTQGSVSSAVPAPLSQLPSLCRAAKSSQDSPRWRCPSGCRAWNGLEEHNGNLEPGESISAFRQRAAEAERDQDPRDAALGGVERVRENRKECKDGEELSLCHVKKSGPNL